jgi:hypothetical protein
MYVCLEEDKKVKNTTQIHVTVLRRQALVFRPTKRDLIALLTHTECRIFLNFRQLFFRETPLRFMVLWMRLVRTTKITDRPPYTTECLTTLPTAGCSFGERIKVSNGEGREPLNTRPLPGLDFSGTVQLVYMS